MRLVNQPFGPTFHRDASSTMARAVQPTTDHNATYPPAVLRNPAEPIDLDDPTHTAKAAHKSGGVPAAFFEGRRLFYVYSIFLLRIPDE